MMTITPEKVVEERLKAIYAMVDICVNCHTRDDMLRYLGNGEFECADLVKCAANNGLFQCENCRDWIEDDGGDWVDGHCNGCRYCYMHGQALWSKADGCWDCRDGKPAMLLDDMPDYNDNKAHPKPGRAAPRFFCSSCRNAKIKITLIQGICELCYRAGAVLGRQ